MGRHVRERNTYPTEHDTGVRRCGDVSGGVDGETGGEGHRRKRLESLSLQNLSSPGVKCFRALL